MGDFPDDCLPPESYFESREALFESINSWAKPRGYAFTTQRSTKEKNGTTTVIYACDGSYSQGGTPLHLRFMLVKASLFFSTTSIRTGI
ncbi:hypothetical protein VTK26DRAFT_7795 [Humicola hyalothermophila]